MTEAMTTEAIEVAKARYGARNIVSQATVLIAFFVCVLLWAVMAPESCACGTDREDVIEECDREPGCIRAAVGGDGMLP
jgi:hypothetical protein